MAHPAQFWAHTRKVRNPQITPDGNYVSFITSYGSGNELVMIHTQGGPENIIPLVPRIGKEYVWLNDLDVAYLSTDGYLYAAGKQITTETGELSSLSISPDAKRAAFVDDLHDVKVVELRPGATPITIASDADFALDTTWTHDGRVVWHEWDVPNMSWDASRISCRRADGSGAISTLAGGDEYAVAQPRVSPDGRSLAYLSEESGWLNLWLLDLGNGERRCLLAEDHEHGNPTWGPGERTFTWLSNNELLVARNEAGNGALVSVTLDGRTERVDDGIYSSLFGPVSLRADATSGTELRYEMVPVVLTTPAFPHRFAPEVVHWQSSDGAIVHGRLYNPGKDRPLIVWVHGGPTSQSPATLYSRFAYFLDRGYAVLVVDYRGTSGWGRSYQQALRNKWGIVDTADVVGGIQAAAANGWGDADRIVVYGGSAGGFTVLNVLIEHDLCAAGVAIYPVTDLVGLAENTWRFEAHYSDTLIGPFDRDLYVQRSPLTRADQIDVPLLVLHGDSDIVVPLAQSQQLVAKVPAADFHVYEGEGHGWRKEGTRVDELERIDAFLTRHVLQIEEAESGR